MAAPLGTGTAHPRPKLLCPMPTEGRMLFYVHTSEGKVEVRELTPAEAARMAATLARWLGEVLKPQEGERG